MSNGQIPLQQVADIDAAIAAAVADALGTAQPLVVPLTTIVDDVPQLVWDADGRLVMTEVPR